MPDNKLIIRRLPPSMKEDEFIKQISPIPNHDYFCFFEASPELGHHSYSRAYINFLDPDDMTKFRERFDNHVFIGKDGHKYQAVVEQSLWHKSPKSGPFYKSPDKKAINYSDTSSEHINKSEKPATEDSTATVGIEQDSDFLDFIAKLQKKGTQQSSIQTLETNLDALTNSSSSLVKKDSSKVITPLLGYVNQKLTTRSSKRNK